MLDPANDLVPPPSSPTISSLSSSDLDTESTGSFFHDRSTTLGTLMGVTLQAITFRATSQHRQQENPVSAVNGGRRNKKPKKSRRRRRGKGDGGGGCAGTNVIPEGHRLGSIWRLRGGLETVVVVVARRRSLKKVLFRSCQEMDGLCSLTGGFCLRSK